MEDSIIEPAEVHELKSLEKAYPIPARLNLWIVAVQVALFFVVVIAISLTTQLWQLGVLSLIFAVLGNSIYSTIHEAEHGILYPNRRVNDALGIGLALLFPAPFHLIRQGHLGHHRRNRSDDEAFDFYFEGDSPFLKYVILYGILTGFYWMLVVLSNLLVIVAPFIFTKKFFDFDRPSAAFMNALNPKLFHVIQLEGALAIALHSLIMWGLGIPIFNYAIVYFGFGFSWSAMQYVHHFGTERHVLHGARNLRFLHWIDQIWLNHNWHLIHHRYPKIPWLYLPMVAADDPSPRESLIWHYLRMWRGPRYTDTRVNLEPKTDSIGEQRRDV